MRSRGCLTNTLFFLVIVFFPLVGHIIATVFILEDDHSSFGKLLWLLIVWLIPFVGLFLYLLFGQRPVNRVPVAFGHASYYDPREQRGNF